MHSNQRNFPPQGTEASEYCSVISSCPDNDTELMSIFRLYDVIQTEKKLTLVFEYMDQDLKKYIDGLGGVSVNVPVMKVSTSLLGGSFLRFVSHSSTNC